MKPDFQDAPGFVPIRSVAVATEFCESGLLVWWDGKAYDPTVYGDKPGKWQCDADAVGYILEE